MTSRVLRAVAFATLAVTTTFWFWVAASLLDVHWPNNGQQIPAVAFILGGVGVLGFGLISTILEHRSLFAQSATFAVLECLSLASLVVIVGAVAFVSSFFVALPWIFLAVVEGTIPISDVVMLVVGLVGSTVAALLYARLRTQVKGLTNPEPPPGVAGSDLPV